MNSYKKISVFLAKKIEPIKEKEKKVRIEQLTQEACLKLSEIALTFIVE